MSVPRPAALKDSQARHQIQLLERRLAKMARLLDERQHIATAAVAAEVEVDDGVASIYRNVQGLSGIGKTVKRKKALMSAIFEANMSLRGQLKDA